MAITPNKVVIPKEYTNLLYGSGWNTAFTATNTVTIDNTSTDYSTINMDWPRYNMVGEFGYLFLPTTISVANGSSNIRYLRCQMNVNNTLDRYRYIRFIFEPSVTYRNTGTVAIPNLTLYFYLVYNGTRYTISKRLNTLTIPANTSFVTSTYSFLFDTVSKTLTDITSLGTDSWVE